MRLDLRGVVVAMLALLGASPSAFAQCSGQALAGQFCGNPTGSTGLPKFAPVPAGSLAPIAGGTVLGNPTGSTAVPVATASPVLGIPGTSAGSLGFAGVHGGTATLAPNAYGAYANKLPSATGGLLAYITPQYVGFKCDGTIEASLIQTSVDALPLYGGNIILTQGSDCKDSGVVAIGAKTNVRIIGATKAHGNSAIENDNVSKLTYTGTAARYIDASSTFGFGLINTALTYSSSSFTGILIDPGFISTIEGNYLGPSTNRTGTATLVNLSTAVDAKIHSNFFYHSAGLGGIKGQTVLGQSTVVDIYDNIFVLSDVVPISGCGESWAFRNNSFEALSNGQAGAFINTIGLQCYAMSWTGNWFGDVTAISGQWIVGYFEGFTFSGNRMAGDLSSTSNGINILGGSGFNFSGGNRFEALSTAINFTNAVTGCVANGDYFAAGVSVKVGGSSNCTNINTDGNSPSTSQVAAGQINVGQSGGDPLPKTMSGAATNNSALVVTINLGAGATVTGLLPSSNLASSLSLVTPNINVATGTSLALNGCTITGLAICATGKATFSDDLRARDTFAARTSNTGYLFFGSDGNHSMGFDGTIYTLATTATFKVPGIVNYQTGIQANGTAGITKTCTIAVGNVLTFTLGILTATSGVAGCV